MPKAVAQFTIYDLYDITASSTAPENPLTDQMWLDSSVIPPVLKMWDGTKWVIVNDYSGEIETVTENIATLTQESDRIKGVVEENTKTIDLHGNTLTQKVDKSTFDQTSTAFTLQFETLGMEGYTRKGQTKFTKDGMEIYNGGIKIKNSSDQLIFGVDTEGMTRVSRIGGTKNLLSSSYAEFQDDISAPGFYLYQKQQYAAGPIIGFLYANGQSRLQAPEEISIRIAENFASGGGIANTEIQMYDGTIKLKTGDTNLYVQSNGVSVLGDITFYDNLYIGASKQYLVSSSNIKSILRTANSTKKYLHLSEPGYGEWGIDIWASDMIYKKDICDSDRNALNDILKIKHRKFKWKDSGISEELGYVAQELEEINPDFVLKIPQPENIEEKYHYQVDQTRLIPTITKAIQEQQQQIERLTQTISDMQQVVAELQEEIRRLKGV